MAETKKKNTTNDDTTKKVETHQEKIDRLKEEEIVIRILGAGFIDKSLNLSGNQGDVLTVSRKVYYILKNKVKLEVVK